MENGMEEKSADKKPITTKRIWMTAVLCGFITFVIDFILFPRIFAGFSPIISNLFTAIFPVLPVIAIYRELEFRLPASVLAGMPVQYLLLILFHGRVSELMGILPADAGLEACLTGVGAWPFITTAIQFFAIFLLKKQAEKGKKDGKKS